MRLIFFIFIIILIICSCAIKDMLDNYLVLQINCEPNIQGLEVYYDNNYVGFTDSEGNFTEKIIFNKYSSHTITFKKNELLIKYNFSEYFSNIERTKLDGKLIPADKYIIINKTEDKFTNILKFKIFYQKYQNDLNEQKKKKKQKFIFKSYIDSLEQNPRWINSLDVNFRVGPSTNEKIIKTLREGCEVYFQLEENGWSKVLFRRENINIKTIDNTDEILGSYIEGWIFSTLLSNEYIYPVSDNFYDFLKKEKKRRQNFLDKNTNISIKYKEAIINGKIILGMTAEMVIASWGYPDDVNKSVTGYGTNEQWIYGDYDSIEEHFLYFDNGILTGWQEY